MTWVWGVDTSTKAVDIGARDLVTGEIATATIHLAAPKAPFEGAHSLASTLTKLHEWFYYLPDQAPCPWWKPSLVVIESPFVRGGGQELMMTYGCVLGSVGQYAMCPIQEVASATWKASCGNGSAGKATAMLWAMDMGYTGDRQDSADALCMTRHAEYLWRLAEQHGDV